LASAVRQSASSSATVMSRFGRGLDELRAKTGRSSAAPGRRLAGCTGGTGFALPAAFAGDIAAGFKGPEAASALPVPMKLLRRAGAVGGVTFVAPQTAVATATSRRGAALGFALGLAAAAASAGA
jgi:hypothetical protein